MNIGDVVAGSAAIGGTFLQDRLNERSRHDAQDFESNMFSHRYQTQVTDLMAAGLNPMMAYLQSPGSAPSSSAQSIQAPDVVGSVNQSRATSAQVANINADTIKKESEVRNIEADTLIKGGMVEQVAMMTVAAMSSAKEANAMVEQIRASIPKIEQEIESIKVRIQHDQKDIQLKDALITAQKYVNSLRMAETRLKNQDVILQQPKVDVIEHNEGAKRLRGSMGASSDVMQYFYRMLNPFK